MENLELVFVEENGQMAINFESLELITSSEFVGQIKNTINVFNRYDINLEQVIFDDIKEYLSVILITDTFVHDFTFNRKTESFTHNKLGRYILKIVSERLNG